MASSQNETSRIVRDLYTLVGRLEDLYPGRHFTLDGHLVGSLGEVYAAERYGLKLLEASSPVHDAKTSSGRRLVQIKTTQRDKVGISERPDYLIVLRLAEDGSFEEVYNGPGQPAWDAAGKRAKNGQRFISLAKLRDLAKSVPARKRIKCVG